MIDDGAEIDGALLKSINNRMWSAEIERQLMERRRLSYACKPEMLEAYRAWHALPWYVRFWRSRAVRIQSFRVRLGEIIAGQTFDD